MSILPACLVPPLSPPCCVQVVKQNLMSACPVPHLSPPPCCVQVVKQNLMSGVWLFIVSEAVLFFGLLWSCVHLGKTSASHAASCAQSRDGREA